MRRPSVYLAGPISGCTYAGANSWRASAKVTLAEHGIDAFSPMRGKQTLLQESKIADHYDEQVLSTMRAIMTRDFFDCQRCDAVIVYLLGSERVSIGTCMEIAWAYAQHKPVIAIMEREGNCHDHGMIREALGYRVTTLEEALLICQSVLLP